MTHLQPRSANRLSRRQREGRAYKLVLATGGLATVGVIGTVLAVLTSIEFFGFPLLALAGAAICGLILRRTISS